MEAIWLARVQCESHDYKVSIRGSKLDLSAAESEAPYAFRGSLRLRRRLGFLMGGLAFASGCGLLGLGRIGVSLGLGLLGLLRLGQKYFPSVFRTSGGFF